MADGMDQAAQAFATEIAPESRPRDQAGRFIQTTGKPEQMFEEREMENDDGRKELPADESRDEQQVEGPDGGQPEQPEGEPEEQAADAPEDDGKEGDEAPVEGDDAPRYEIDFGNEKKKLSAKQITEGFQKLVSTAPQVNQLIDNANQITSHYSQERDKLINKLNEYEGLLRTIIPKEPENWDELYKQNPAQAHEFEKNYRALYGKIDSFYQERTQLEQQRAQEIQQQTAQHAVAAFNAWRSENGLVDEADTRKEVESMRRTLLSAGFHEHEIAGIVDKRMHTVIQKASKYDRMQANKPIAKPAPDVGKTLSPGSTPRNATVNGVRRNIDQSMKRVEKSGRVEDATDYFARIIR